MNFIRNLVQFGQRLILGPHNLAAESLRKYPGTPMNSDKFIRNIVASRDTGVIDELLRYQGYSSTNIVKHNQRIRDKDRRDFLGVIDDYRKAHPCRRLDNLEFEFVDSGTPNAVVSHVRADKSFAIGMDPRLDGVLAWLIDFAYVTYRKNAPEEFLQIVTDSVQSTFLRIPLSQKANAFYLNYVKVAESCRPSWRDWIGPMVAKFLIGHEIGHIYLDHFANGQAACLRLNPQVDRDDEISAFDYRLEFEADAWAANSMIGGGTGGVLSNLTSRTIPSILFSIFAVIDDLYEPSTTIATTLQKSHPPAWERATELSKIGALAPDVKIPMKDLDALFHISGFINSARLSPNFQEFAGRFRKRRFEGEVNV
jgi:hypothetical protein